MARGRGTPVARLLLLIGSPGATLLPANGTSHIWNLSYDPGGNAGGGRITFTIDAQTFTLDLALGDKAEGAVFDRFGMFNQQTDGSYLTAYFDDLVIDGVTETFSANPGWSAVRNQGTFADCEAGEWHNFGFSPTTRSGGANGEIGGLLWRTERSVPTAGGLLRRGRAGHGFEHGIASRRPVVMTRAAWTARCCSVGSTPRRPGREKRRRAISWASYRGPSRVGYYFRGAYNNSAGAKRVSERAVHHAGSDANGLVFHYSPTATATTAASPSRSTARRSFSTWIRESKPGERCSTASVSSMSRPGAISSKRISTTSPTPFFNLIPMTTALPTHGNWPTGWTRTIPQTQTRTRMATGCPTCRNSWPAPTRAIQPADCRTKRSNGSGRMCA